MKNTTNSAPMPNFQPMVPIMQPAKNKLLSHKLIFLLGLAPVFLLGLPGCSNVNEYGMNAIGMNVTSISELKPKKGDKNPPIYVQGKVERKVPLLEQQMYQINDSTGKVWVLTNQKGWQVGQKIVVKAIPQFQSVPISGAELGEVYLEEK